MDLRAFIVDLTIYLRSIKTSNSKVVIMGDLNEVVGLSESGFNKITNEFDLVDVMAHFHSITHEVATYSRGSKRIDYIFCSSNLIPAIRSCGIEPFNKHILSDHRSLFVDWKEDTLFGSQAPLVTAKQFRRLQSTNLEAKGEYLLRLCTYFDKHNVFKRLSDLEECETTDWRKAERLDKDITRGMIQSEKHCRHRGRDPWSLKLKKARLKVEILKLEMSMLKTRRDFRTRFDTLTDEYGELLDIPSTRLDLNKELRNAQNELKALLKIAIDERRKFIQDKHTQAMISNDSKEATKWKNQQNADEIKAMFESCGS